MFRFKVVLAVVYCLGLLISCGPGASERPVPGDSPGSLRLALGQPVIQVSPTELSFGTQKVGTSSASKVVSVRNTGDVTLQVDAISIGAGEPFSVSSSAPLSVPPGETRVLFVKFVPTSEGPSTGTLTLSSNDPANAQVNIALTGTGVTFATEVSPASLAFGAQRVGTTSPSQTVTVRNNGASALQITGLGITGPFTVSPTTAFTLAAGGSKQLTVAFSPTAEGVAPGTLTLTTDEPGLSTVAISLSGTGVRPVLELSATALDFGDQRVGTSTMRVVTVRNSGSSAITLTNAVLSGAAAFSFAPPPAMPMTLEPGTSWELTVRYNPTAETSDTGTLTLNTTDPDFASVVVALGGKGVKPQLVVSTTSLDFLDVRLGSQVALPVTLGNSGSGDVTLQSITVEAPFAAVPRDGVVLPRKLAPGTSLIVDVIFKPAALGTANGTVSILGDADASPLKVVLTGRGVDGRMSLTPGAVSFPAVEVGSSGTKMSVTLSNTGDAPLTLTGLIPPADAAFSISGLSAGTVLQPGEGQTFSVIFAPVKRGYVSASAIIKSDAVIVPSINLSLEGTGVGATVELLPGELNFGKLNVGVTATRDIAIKNVGEKDLLVSNIAFEDAVSGAALDFSVGGSGVFPLIVPPGQSTLVSLAFTPREVGLRQARAIVYTNDKNAEVRLQGEGTSPHLSLSSSSLDFGAVLVGTPSAPRVLALTNTGTGPLILTSMTLGGVDVASFTLTVPALPVTLPPGSSTEVFLALKPEAERSFSAQLVVASNDSGAPSVAVPLSGMGVRSQVQLLPSTLEFGPQLIDHTSRPRKLSITNNGGANVTLTALAVKGTGASRFSLAMPVLPLVLAPGQTRELEVTFTPLSEAEVSSTLEVSFSELPQPLEGTLHGKGIPTVLSINPSPLDFGVVRAGGAKREQPLTLTNLSSEPIVLAAPEVTYSTGEPFGYDGASLAGRTLEPGMSIIVPVSYQPMVESLSETTLSFGTTTPASPRAVDVSLEGSATKRLLLADQQSLAFGRVDVDVPVEPKGVTVTNRSSQPQRVVVKLKDVEGTPFSLQTSALEAPLPPGGSATFKVAFQPRTEGDAQNEVQVWLQGETEADALIAVTGTGFSGKAGEGEGPGCSCGSTEVGSSGMLALLMLVGLGARRRRG